ncbi:MAG: putative 4-mercaptohistidine N1-methyltransferase [Verrucomicrobiota bacterium]
MNYESDELLSQYLLLHYGWHEDVLTHWAGMAEFLDYPWKCAELCLDQLPEGDHYRALDLGCAVGRSSFELARRCREVIAIDYSAKFIEVASYLRDQGSYYYQRKDEGDLRTPLLAQVPDGIYRQHVHFEQGDACALREDLGTFDCVLMANLLCRLQRPDLCLQRLPSMLNSGGFALITTPATWSEEYTAKEYWLGGYERDGQPVKTEDGIREMLSPELHCFRSGEIPFLIREHERKYQWSLARFTLWRKP